MRRRLRSNAAQLHGLNAGPGPRIDFLKAACGRRPKSFDGKPKATVFPRSLVWRCPLTVESRVLRPTRVGNTRMPDQQHPLATREPVAEVRLLGRVPFEAFLTLQSRLVYEAGGLAEPRIVVLLCEHPDLITVGRAGSRGHIRFTNDQLQARATGHPLDQPGRWLRAARSRPIGRLSDRAAGSAGLDRGRVPAAIAAGDCRWVCGTERTRRDSPEASESGGDPGCWPMSAWRCAAGSPLMVRSSTSTPPCGATRLWTSFRRIRTGTAENRSWVASWPNGKRPLE